MKIKCAKKFGWANQWKFITAKFSRFKLSPCIHHIETKLPTFTESLMPATMDGQMDGWQWHGCHVITQSSGLFEHMLWTRVHSLWVVFTENQNESIFYVLLHFITYKYGEWTIHQHLQVHYSIKHVFHILLY